MKLITSWMPRRVEDYQPKKGRPRPAWTYRQNRRSDYWAEQRRKENPAGGFVEITK